MKPNEELMQDDPDEPICKKCGSPYSYVGDRTEPTPFCDGCAHIEVERLTKANSQLQQQVDELKKDKESLIYAIRHTISVLHNGGGTGHEVVRLQQAIDAAIANAKENSK